MRQFNLQNYTKVFINSLIIIVALAGVIGLQRLSLRKTFQPEEEYVRQAKATATALSVQKQFPSFGFDNLLADWAYLQFVQYFGDTEARRATDYSLVPEYFEMVVDNDPRFVRAHLIFSTANSIFAAEPQKTVDYLSESLEFLSPEVHPRAYAIWQFKGLDEMMLLGDIEAAKYSYARAAEWAEAVGEENIARRAKETAAFLETNPDSKRARVTGLVTILTWQPDEQTRQKVIQQIEELGGKVTRRGGGFTVSLPEED